MKKNRGFTLIELLAVIAILALILLVAVPKVIDTINSSKESSLTSSASMVWQKAEDYVTMNQINPTTYSLPTISVTAKGFKTTAAGEYKAIPELVGFNGTYDVKMGTAGSYNITEVSVSNGVVGTDYTCTITSKNGTAECS